MEAFGENVLSVMLLIGTFVLMYYVFRLFKAWHNGIRGVRTRQDEPSQFALRWTLFLAFVTVWNMVIWALISLCTGHHPH
jgi:hypothetical protein